MYKLLSQKNMVKIEVAYCTIYVISLRLQKSKPSSWLLAGKLVKQHKYNEN